MNKADLGLTVKETTLRSPEPGTTRGQTQGGAHHLFPFAPILESVLTVIRPHHAQPRHNQPIYDPSKPVVLNLPKAPTF